MMNFHLAGGPEGMKHVLDHFGPTLKGAVDSSRRPGADR